MDPKIALLLSDHRKIFLPEAGEILTGHGDDETYLIAHYSRSSVCRRHESARLSGCCAEASGAF